MAGNVEAASEASRPQAAGATAALIVQQSFPRPRPTTNPYLVMLRDALDGVEGVSVKTFSWRSAILSRSDVFHVHWPEILVSGHSPLKKVARQALTLALVAKLAVTRTPIVRTQHNLELPQGISRRERWILALIARRTRLWIVLNDQTPVPGGAASALIPHGHYRDWYGRYPKPDAVAGRAAFVGLVRRYKGVERLVDEFSGLEGDVSLHVAGRPSSDDLAEELAERAASDPRIVLALRFLDEEELVREVGEARLVVLPYREMHNSGGVLTALSLGRPVLVPANEVNRRLADEVGPAWVRQYDGDLDAADIVSAFEESADPATGAPDLSRRDWSLAGEAHAAAYRQAVRMARGRREGGER
jgi:beta-1,4-mannosyltransferase